MLGVAYDARVAAATGAAAASTAATDAGIGTAYDFTNGWS